MKIVCQAEAGDEPEEPVDNSKGPRVGTKQYLNAVSPIQYMNVWFPAHWAPVVMEVLETKNEDFRKKYPRWVPREEFSPSLRQLQTKQRKQRTKFLQRKDG